MIYCDFLAEFTTLKSVRNITYEFISEKYKTNPICRIPKLIQTQYLQRIKNNLCSIRAQKTKPIQTQSNPIKACPERSRMGQFFNEANIWS